ncbi:MAG: iron chelate uptake ABC transporter family permease subunit [Leucobacter sp.]|nr:iron chelate uptake ABC transporter family permease subunit [Leucobacter sp.]
MKIDRSHLVTGWIVSFGTITLRVSRRGVIVGGVLVALVLLVAWALLMHGTLQFSASEVLAAVFGQGEDRTLRTVQNRRLPRLITALLVGGCLGVAGAVFQSVSRNALASPDIIGFTAGAATGAIIQMILFGPDMLRTAIAAIIGGIIASVAVYLLSRRDGASGGVRFVLVGIGVGAIATAASGLLIVQAPLQDATAAQVWLSGTLSGRGWPHVISLLILTAITVPVLAWLSQRLTMIEMGDELAMGLGVGVERTRTIAIAIGVLLTAVAVAATGPIAFIALAAPQIARRLMKRGALPLASSFTLGAVLLALSDLLSQWLEIGLRTPVGTMTSLLGGVYLIWLLARKA